ncbi:MAG TPA: hypothetical protein DC058_10325 [Planctomycetaceae bacterium]|nr:hypothetical protein [Planctomycetaceae bacterium]
MWGEATGKRTDERELSASRCLEFKACRIFRQTRLENRRFTGTASFLIHENPPISFPVAGNASL